MEGLLKWATENTRSTLLKTLKTTHLPLHQAFVCGEPTVDVTNNIIGIAISTENLLLNARRQQEYGLPTVVSVDTTHKLVLEGHCNLLLGNVDSGQHFHTIGYGFCSNEDTQMHTRIVCCLVEELEKVVEQRFQDGMEI